MRVCGFSFELLGKLSFQQAKRVGNLSENKERFRASRNDMDAERGFIDDRIKMKEAKWKI